MLTRIHRVNQQKQINDFFGPQFKKLRGYSVSAPGLVVKSLKNQTALSRFGFIVNVKVDKRAVVRNRVKRQLREIIRVNLHKIQPGYDVLFIVKPELAKMEYPAIKKTAASLLGRLGLIK